MTQLVVTALGVLDGADPDGVCEVVGTGQVPRQYLKTLSPPTPCWPGCSTTGRDGYCGWDVTSVSGTPRSGSVSQYGTGDASNAAPPCTNATYTTSKNGATVAEPTSTISSPSAPGITNGSKKRTCRYDESTDAGRLNPATALNDRWVETCPNPNAYRTTTKRTHKHRHPVRTAGDQIKTHPTTEG